MISRFARIEEVPSSITDAQRARVIEDALWGAFDTFALHAIGIELGEEDV